MDLIKGTINFIKDLMAFTVLVSIILFIIHGTTKSDPTFEGQPKTAEDMVKFRPLFDKSVPKVKLSEKRLKKLFNIQEEYIAKEILESNEAWDGPCACPYNLDKDGAWCAGNSHYSLSNTLRLACYPDDVLNRRRL